MGGDNRKKARGSPDDPQMTIAKSRHTPRTVPQALKLQHGVNWTVRDAQQAQPRHGQRWSQEEHDRCLLAHVKFACDPNLGRRRLSKVALVSTRSKGAVLAHLKTHEVQLKKDRNTIRRGPGTRHLLDSQLAACAVGEDCADAAEACGEVMDDELTDVLEGRGHGDALGELKRLGGLERLACQVVDGARRELDGPSGGPQFRSVAAVAYEAASPTQEQVRAEREARRAQDRVVAQKPEPTPLGRPPAAAMSVEETDPACRPLTVDDIYLDVRRMWEQVSAMDPAVPWTWVHVVRKRRRTVDPARTQ